MFANVIKDFKERLYKLPSKSDVFQGCVKEKLDNSYEMYLFNLKKMYNYLLYRSNLKVLKTINREEEKAEEAEEIESEDDYE